MRALPVQQHRSSPQVSSRDAQPNAKHAVPRAHPASHLQHAIGNQRTLRLLQLTHPSTDFLPTTHAGSHNPAELAVAPSPAAMQFSGSGHAMDPALRIDMEQRFACDFTQVRIHNDAAAASSAEALGAIAYTLGQHVWFGKGAYDPHGVAGRRLIAHELAHTIQQRGPGSEAAGRASGRELEAHRAADHALAGRATPALSASGTAVSRQPLSEMPNSVEWVDGRIAIVMQQLQMPVLPPHMRAMLEAQLIQLQLRRRQLLTGAGMGPPVVEKRIPQPCDILGKTPPTPDVIRKRLFEIDSATAQLQIAVISPGPLTYEMARPSLRMLELQRLQLLRCAASRGTKGKPGDASQPETAETRLAKQAQAELDHKARQLAEKQAERKEYSDWDKLSHDKVVELDLVESYHVGVSRRHLGLTHIREVTRDPFISTLEEQVPSDVYNRTLWDLTNQPEPESLFHKIVSGGICEHVEPCKSNLEALRADKASGMSDEEALNRGMFRMFLFAATAFGKSGPGDLQPIGGGRLPGPGPVTPINPKGSSLVGKAAAEVAKALDQAGINPRMPSGGTTGRPTPTISAPAPKDVAAPTPDPLSPSTKVTVSPPKVPNEPVQAPTAAKPPAAEVTPAAKSPEAKPVPNPATVRTPTPPATTGATRPNPPVTVLPHGSRPFTPDYAANPTGRVDVRGQYTFHEFERNGKHYQQARGRLGVPGEVETHREPPAQGRVSRHTGDDAGHLAANEFGPPGDERNLSRQNWVLNRFGNFRRLEQAWGNLLRRGIEIDVQVTDVTRIGEDRPFMRNVQWTETNVDGTQKSYELNFANTTTPQSRQASGVPPASGGGGKVIRGDFGGGN